MPILVFIVSLLWFVIDGLERILFKLGQGPVDGKVIVGLMDVWNVLIRLVFGALKSLLISIVVFALLYKIGKFIADMFDLFIYGLS